MAGGLLAVGLTATGARGRAFGMATLVLAGLVADANVVPLGREFLTPLDEGIVMDMPISVPRMSIAQGIDDLKARDMVLCRFPEVAMVTGKLGRAETPTDPAPLDMIETMVEFHPREFWPARSLEPEVAARQVGAVVAEMARRGLVDAPDRATEGEIVESCQSLFDAQMREYAYQRNRELFRSSGFDEVSWRMDGLSAEALRRWRCACALARRRAPRARRGALDEAGDRGDPGPGQAAEAGPGRLHRRVEAPAGRRPPPGPIIRREGPATPCRARPTMPAGLAPVPELDVLQEELTAAFGRGLILWRRRREDLIGFGGELDRAVPMPGWTNVWTMPIQNRVDMLSTGVNTTVGVRVVGRKLDDVVAASVRIADVVKTVRGAVDVVADPVRGKGVIDVRADRDRAARLGVGVGEINAVVEAGLAGRVATHLVDGRERTAVRVRYARPYREDEESVRGLLVRSLPPALPAPRA